MESFLSTRQQRTINNAFSRYSEIMEFHKGQFWIPYFSISISVAHFFDIIECDIASYADDNTPYNSDFNLDNVINNLEKSTNSLLNWFRENHLKANANK